MRVIHFVASALLLGVLTACGGEESAPADSAAQPGSAVASGRLPSGQRVDSAAVTATTDSAHAPAVRSDTAPPPTGVAPGGTTRPPASPPPSSSGGAQQPGAGAQDPAAVLRRTAEVYEGLRTMRADFTMVVANPLLGSRTTSRGTLYQRRPDRILLDFSEPDGDVIVSDGTWFWIYYPSANADQVIRSAAAQAGAGGVDLWAQFVGDPTERFEYTMHATESVNGRRAHVFTLVPRDNAGYRQLKVWIDAEDALVRRFELTELNGSVREFALSSLERNPSIPEDRFSFMPPPNARVITR